MKVLIVDDEQNIVNVLKEYCEYNNFETEVAFDGLQALQKVSSENFDCVVMDIMMPNMDGYEAVANMRKIKNTPIILCSAKVEEYDRLRGFELGVDDYIVKPFSPKEVIARIKAVVRRGNSTGDDICQIGQMKIDYSARKVYVCSNIVEMTNKEFELLQLLVKNNGKFVSREKIITEVWRGEGKDGRTVDTHIKMLRADLGVCGDYIKTVRGAGYRFEKEI